MKRRLTAAQLVLSLILGQQAFATQGQLFNVRVAPPGLTMNIPGVPVQINTTIPGKSYQYSGILVNTPGYTVVPNLGTQCSMSPNGYCLFSVSDTTSAIIVVSLPVTIKTNFDPLPPAPVSMTLCLNGKEHPFSCENHTIVFNGPI